MNPKSNSNGFRKILGIEQLPNALKTKCSTITFVKFQSKKKDDHMMKKKFMFLN